MSYIQKFSLKEPLREFPANPNEGLVTWNGRYLGVQVRYMRSAEFAPTGKFGLWVRTTSSAPFIPARKLDGSPVEIIVNGNGSNRGEDEIQFEGVYSTFRLIWKRDPYTDPNPSDKSLETNWLEAWYLTK